MKLQPLRRFGDHPDMSDYVVHMTGLRSSRLNDLVDSDIHQMSALQRLLKILASQQLRAFHPWGNLDCDPVVCFSEASGSALRYLIGQGRYEPYGVGFLKDTVFAAGGGPAFYLRGDEWPLAKDVPKELRFRFTRYWPGANGENDEPMAQYLKSPSEWIYEREWRMRAPALTSPPAWNFQLEDVAFVILPNPRPSEIVALLHWLSTPDLPVVTLSASGEPIDDPIGLFD